MPDYSQFTNRQEVGTEDLQHLTDQMFDSFADTNERDRQLPNPPLGKPVLLRDTFGVQHRGRSGWVDKFPREIVELEDRDQFVGVLPARRHSWSEKYLTLYRDDYYRELRDGHLPIISTPFGYWSGGQWNPGFNPVSTATAGAVHNEHITYTITGGTATVLTDFDAQVVCVGNGGAGQNWLDSGGGGWRDGQYTRPALGGAGGGAGAVVEMINRFRAGDVINVSTSEPAKISVNGATLLEAQTGETQVTYPSQSVDYRWSEGDPPAVQLLAASGAGAPAARTPIGATSQRYLFNTRNDIRTSVMGLRVYANRGAGSTSTWTPSTRTAVWQAGAGGGPALSLPFWSTPQVVAQGGPGGSNSAQGAPIPTGYGSGGAGGGGRGTTAGTRGVTGAVFIRYPLLGLPLAHASLT